VTIKCVRRKILFSGFSGQKSPNGMGKISILGVPSACSGQALFDSAPPSTVCRDKSVWRSPQDDDSLGVLKKNIPNKLALMG